MVNIIDSPQSNLNRWNYIEAHLRKSVEQAGRPVECADFVVGQVFKVFDQYMKGATLQIGNWMGDADIVQMLGTEMEKRWIAKTDALFLALSEAYIVCWGLMNEQMCDVLQNEVNRLVEGGIMPGTQLRSIYSQKTREANHEL